MATYIELHTLRGSADLEPLRQKINVGIAIKAHMLANLPTPTPAQKAFAIAALQSPETYQTTVLNYILAEYSTATVAAITGAADAQVQTAVNAAVDTLLGV